MFCNGFGGYGGFSPVGSIGYGGMFLVMGFKFLIFISIILVAVKVFKSHTNKSNDAIKILNEKFASGDINEEEYLKRKSILSKKN